MTDQEQSSEVLDNSTKTESNEAGTEAIDNVADETINNIDQPDLTKSDIKEEEEEEVTLENVKLPEEKKELTKEDHILKRKERQIEREHKRRVIDEQNIQLEKLKQENEEIRKRSLVTEVNSYRAPIREDFESDEDFIDSRLQYNIAKSAAVRIEQEEQEKVAKSKEIFIEKLADAQGKGQDKYGDFDDVTEELGKPGTLTNKPLVDAVLDSDYAADVFYLMGKYPSIREKLNNMEPIKAIKELAKLEQRFEQQLKAKKVAAPATKIIEPMNQRSGNTLKKRLEDFTEAELNSLPDKDFRRIMKEQSRSHTY